MAKKTDPKPEPTRHIRAVDHALEQARQRQERKREQLRRTRLHSFGLAGGRRTFPRED